jgi:2-succinyl-6-hydroxy-2,4-cyclohexadiene-1-carboxylate synthase
VALHGQMGMASDWDAHAKELTKGGHQLDMVDLWRYLEGGEIGLEAFGEKLNKDQDDGQVLLGYSMGGRLALQALIDQPQKWKAAVIISAHVGLSQEERQPRRIIDNEWASKLENLPWSEFLSEWNRQGVLGNDVMPDRSGLEVRKAEVSRSYRCWSLAEQEDLLEKLASIEIPVLWVVGENDEKFYIQGERAVSRLKDAKVLKIPNSGHRVPWEAEADLVDAIAQWISDAV